jgi:hypothetical protein
MAQHMAGATRRAIEKLTEAHGLAVKTRGDGSEVLLVTDLTNERHPAGG